ncbi:MAG: aminotransferase class I/II-fold pyridoxal phosphate-dependent enzyme [Bacteroidota bacterium]
MLGPEIEFVERDYVLYEGKKLLYLAGIDYHRMSNHPMIIETMSDAAYKYGLNPTGSRTTTGNHSLYIQLEKKVAEFFSSETATVFTSGYLSNMILLQTIAEDFDVFLIDEAAHSSIVDASKLFDKKIIKYKFLDSQHLKEQLRKNISGNSKILIMTDGVFPARGDIPPLDEYAEILSDYNGKILIDDAHAMAVVGNTGKGSWEEKGIDRELIYQTGTLSKGFGTFGGIIPGSAELIKKIQKKSDAYVGSTGLALPLAAAAIKSISYIKSNQRLIHELQQKTLVLKEKFADLGFEMPMTSAPIFSITLNDVEKNKMLKNIFVENGIYPSFINYPGAPPGGHFRFIITSTTTDEQIELLFDTIKSAFSILGFRDGIRKYGS